MRITRYEIRFTVSFWTRSYALCPLILSKFEMCTLPSTSRQSLKSENLNFINETMQNYFPQIHGMICELFFSVLLASFFRTVLSNFFEWYHTVAKTFTQVERGYNLIQYLTIPKVFVHYDMHFNPNHNIILKNA